MKQCYYCFNVFQLLLYHYKQADTVNFADVIYVALYQIDFVYELETIGIIISKMSYQCNTTTKWVAMSTGQRNYTIKRTHFFVLTIRYK